MDMRRHFMVKPVSVNSCHESSIFLWDKTVSSSQFVHLLLFAQVKNHLERVWKTSLSIRYFVCRFNFDCSFILSGEILQKCALKLSNRSPASDSQSDILSFYLLTPHILWFCWVLKLEKIEGWNYIAGLVPLPFSSPVAQGRRALMWRTIHRNLQIEERR